MRVLNTLLAGLLFVESLPPPKTDFAGEMSRFLKGKGERKERLRRRLAEKGKGEKEIEREVRRLEMKGKGFGWGKGKRNLRLRRRLAEKAKGGFGP